MKLEIKKSPHMREWSHFIEDVIADETVAAICNNQDAEENQHIADLFSAAPEMFYALDNGSIIPTGQYAGRFMVDASLVTAAMMKARGLGPEDMENDSQ